MLPHVDCLRSESPSRYATARTLKCVESRPDCESLFAAGGCWSARHSVVWGEGGFVGGTRISSINCGSMEYVEVCPPSSASAALGGLRRAASLKLRLASRSFDLGWWRWRESNPRPKAFSEQSLHAYPTQLVSRARRWNRQDRRSASPVEFRPPSRSLKGSLACYVTPRPDPTGKIGETWLLLSSQC